MKITENTPHRLVFEAQPGFLSVFGRRHLVMLVLTLVLFVAGDRDSWVFVVGLAIFATALASGARRTALGLDGHSGKAGFLTNHFGARRRRSCR